VAEEIGTGKSAFIIRECSAEFQYPILGSTSIIGYSDSFDYEGNFILTARVGANAGTLYRYDGKVKITDNTVFIKNDLLDYLFYLLDKTDLKKLSFGTGQPLIKSSELKILLLHFPEAAEQTLIGTFFRTLDDTIALFKRKLDGLKKLKSAYLQQMFPQEGECVPKVRFNGFTGKWVKKRLGEVVEKVKSYSLSRDVETEEATGYRYIHYGDIHKQIADLITCDEQLPYIKYGDYFTLNQGDLILADASEDYTGIAEPSVILHEPTDKIIAGLHTIALRPKNTNSLYLYYLMHTEDFKKFGGYVGTGLKVFGITFNNLSLYETRLPSLPEQTAIGNFFKNLDDQIAAYQTKLDKLNQLKAAYLQKMFIST